MSLTDYNNPGSELLQGGGRVVSARALPSEKVTADQIKAGTVVIEEGTPLPDSLNFESKPYSNGWRSVKNLNGYGLDRKIREAGWTLFDLAQIKASVFGFDREKATRRALHRVLAKEGEIGRSLGKPLAHPAGSLGGSPPGLEHPPVSKERAFQN